ncbi:collagen alpha-1(I) chain-like isoform X1 [Lynx rufus]|uniref:collagen alpha-1(I) chain-like isoform X1 n=1 Tax=Lynx rufus TaxID=61384 RepID=UPI001F123112|nr:collagen alpha-1(I) chain-like isoform X1 [Lynx rufus]
MKGWGRAHGGLHPCTHAEGVEGCIHLTGASAASGGARGAPGPLEPLPWAQASARSVDWALPPGGAQPPQPPGGPHGKHFQPTPGIYLTRGETVPDGETVQSTHCQRRVAPGHIHTPAGGPGPLRLQTPHPRGSLGQALHLSRQARVGVEPTADELRGRILPTERSAPAGSQPKPGPQGDGEGAAKWGPQWCLPCLTEPRKAERQDEGSQGPQACATPRTQLTLGSTCYIG